MPVQVLLFEGLFAVLVDLVVEVDALTIVDGVVESFAFAFERHLLASVLTVRLRQLALLAAGRVGEFALAALQLGHLLLEDLDLSVEHELLPLDLERLLGQVLDSAVEVAPHLPVLVLQQTDVLVRRLVVVVKTADSRLLFILDHLLPQNFELELHEVDLLLEVDDVLVSGVDVGV